jgi:2-succinyl-5-enolpyruvyl-6-hydroxy-3-cyclohexene-1-carboxylate synthase
MTRHIQMLPADLFQFLSTLPVNDDFSMQTQANYLQLWRREENALMKNLEDLFESDIPLGEFQMVYSALKEMPDEANLHLANSLAVRYANLCGIQDKDNVEVYSNRGACGIDGCNSTAVGVSLTDPDRINLLITGDMAFFYDRNAFWHNYSMPNLRIIVLNNHGGGIFRMIQGPSGLPELEPFFETKQNLSAEGLATEFGFDYIRCDKKTKIINLLQDFYLPDKRVKIMEIETLSSDNQDIMTSFKSKFR